MRHAMVIDRRFDDDLPQPCKIAVQRRVIAVGDFVGLGEDGRAAFHVEKPHRPLKREAQLLRIEQVKRRQVVLAKPQVLEGALQFGRIDEQIRDDDDQRPLRESSRPTRAARHQLRVAAGFDPLQADRTAASGGPGCAAAESR